MKRHQDGLVKSTKAFPVTTPMDATGNAFFTQSIQKNVEQKLEDKIKVGVFSAIMRLVSYFVQKVSYDLAVYAASGGKGQGALAQNLAYPLLSCRT